MADLSPAAQAVLDALKMEGLTGPERFWARAHAAAALRAAADQVVPVEPKIPDGDLTEQAYRHDERYGIRAQLLALATELEATP